jgi:hypothetical protein
MPLHKQNLHTTVLDTVPWVNHHSRLCFYNVLNMCCPKHVLDLMPVQNGVEFSVAAEKMAMDA